MLKDIRLKDLSKCLIADNLGITFNSQIEYGENAIHIKTVYDDRSDTNVYDIATSVEIFKLLNIEETLVPIHCQVIDCVINIVRIDVVVIIPIQQIQD